MRRFYIGTIDISFINKLIFTNYKRMIERIMMIDEFYESAPGNRDILSAGKLKSSLRLINDFVKRHDKRLQVNSQYLQRFSTTGRTTEDLGHRHIYRLDEDGNGYTEYAHHPDEPSIRHRHEVRNWQVLPAKSGCYPNCEERFSYTGVANHVHSIDRRGKFGPDIYTTS